MRDIDTFLPLVRRWAPTVPDPTALTAIRDTARNFCERTRIWRESDRITVTRPDAQGICSVPDSEIFEIERADWKSKPPDGEEDPNPDVWDHELKPKTVYWLDTERPLWQTWDDGEPAFITQLYPDTVTVAPKAEGTIFARFILMPADDALTLPDILRQHREAIAKGAAAKVLDLPNREYSNPAQAVKLMADYDKVADTEKFRKARTVVRGRAHAKGRYF